MNASRGLATTAMLIAMLALPGCSRRDAGPSAAPVASRAGSASIASVATLQAAAPVHVTLPAFTPPPDSAIPDDPFGALVREGREIFVHTGQVAKGYVGNGLSCENCHLDAGRLPNSAPMWAAYVRYPRYRAKNGKVNTFAERLQGCFRFSMNGKAPPADSEVIKALTAYSYWLATGAPTGKDLAGFGYPTEGFKPAQAPDYARGAKVYASHCALCHGTDGEGQQAAGGYVFPPLWGAESFNWGAGMGNVNNAAAFIKANMPFSRGGTLTDQQAWDVAYYMDAHERPQDPRFKGSIAATRKQHHDSKWSLYGTVVNGRLLGAGTPAAKR